jgi:cation diffusion facilitator family transporter
VSVAAYLKLSIAVAVLAIALKAGAWWLTGSVGMLSDALESLVNLAGAGFALAMVTLAAAPPDDEHPYGHHKAEYFSSGFEGVLIGVAALAIGAVALHRLWQPQPLEQLGWGGALSLAATALNGALAWAMLRKARAQRSIALEADARHLMSDVWTSVGVVAGVLLAGYTGWLWLDPLIALAVAALIARTALVLLRRSADGLMDAALEPELRARVDAVLASFAHPAIRFDHVVTRRAGRRHHVELHLHLPATWSLGKAAALRAAVEQALVRSVPGLRATIQLLPRDTETHDVDPGERPGA